jgi:hypothetical protein
MKDQHRKETARRLAEKYAPAPVDTWLMYGVTAASSMLVLVIVIGAFYSIDVGLHLAAVAVLAGIAFIAGLVLRRLQASRHGRAHRAEYDGIGQSSHGEREKIDGSGSHLPISLKTSVQREGRSLT